jgi:GAF domain-containing protein
LEDTKEQTGAFQWPAELGYLVELAPQLAERRDLAASLALAAQAARQLVGATYTSIGFVHGDHIRWESAAGKPIAEVQGYRQSLDHGLSAWVVRHGRSRRSPDVTREADYYCQYAEMRSELDVPIKSGHQVIGVLNAESPKVDAFSEEHEMLLQLLAGFVAIAVSRLLKEGTIEYRQEDDV